MGVTDKALAALFANPVMGKAATWFPGGTGPGQSLRVILRSPDTVTEFGAARIWSETVIADIRVSEAPSLATGDRIDIDGISYTVQGEPLRDRERLIWTVELVPV
ncbi:head-tail joining protein [Profundibacter sp.]|uniref:head-tail joining protein n=1 Tax=Profundibacter sp. TaxID=3101071 RepID=UPI003D143F12